MLTSENDVRALCSGGVEHVCACCWGEFEGRVRWVLHGNRGLCVRFLLENSRFSVLGYMLLWMSGIVRLGLEGMK